MNVCKTIVLESGQRLTRSSAEVPDDLWERIALLPADERTLLELSLRVGASYRTIARMLKRSPGSVCRSIRRLGRRLHDPLVVALTDRDCPLDPTYRQIAVEHFLTGLSVPRLAKKHQRPPAEVRRIVHFVSHWHRGVGRRSSRRGAATARN
jgi:DNA-directed RNA polymerase specialized sigma24 family protein